MELAVTGWTSTSFTSDCLFGGILQKRRSSGKSSLHLADGAVQNQRSSQQTGRTRQVRVGGWVRLIDTGMTESTQRHRYLRVSEGGS